MDCQIEAIVTSVHIRLMQHGYKKEENQTQNKQGLTVTSV